MSFQMGLLVFPGMTQLDATGPYEVLSRLADSQIHLIGLSGDPVLTDSGLKLFPSLSRDESPPLDLLCVPGGRGINALLRDDATLTWIARQGATAQYVTSVCTGALALGAAGLLNGYRATTHWLSLELLPLFGAVPLAERVVVDRNRITGGGVTAGIDFGLRVAAELRGATAAQEIQLLIEYDPEPPFRCGSPKVATPALVESVRMSRHRLQDERRALIEDVVARRRLL